MNRAMMVLFVLASFSATAVAEGPFVDMSYADACAAAKKADKLVLIDFYTTWCKPCKMLDQTTFKDDAVVKALKEKTIALKVDAEKQPALQKQFAVTAYPTIVIIKPDGTVIDRIVGYRDAKTFLSEFDAALSGKDAVARAREAAAKSNNDPMARMRVGDELARQGKNEEALAEYLWCFDHGLEHGRGFYGVRLSFLLGDITRLGATYPPAIKALEERRDAAEKAVVDFARQCKARDASIKPDKEKAGKMFQTAHDLAALNRELDANERTAGVFEECRGDGFELERLRATMADEVFKVYLGQRRYEHILKVMNDIIENTPRDIAHYLDCKSGRMGAKFPPDTLEVMRDIMLRDVGNSYEALLGAGEINRACKLGDQALAAEDVGATHVTLIEAALRAEQLGVARSLIDRARKSLGEKELKKVEKVAKELPPIG